MSKDTTIPRNYAGKQLDGAAFETIKKMAEKGASYDETARELDKLGYVSTLGLKLTQSLVSNFAIKNGLRARPKRLNTHRRVSPKFVGAPAETTTPVIKSAEEVANEERAATDAVLNILAQANLPKDKKRRIVSILLED